ncbi:hypothetical protein HK104_006883 [Borealophlyctis nickersoniae]|nr:hypothetical protein HK104_006883 [Borealophlyctis nickersoniae]
MDGYDTDFDPLPNVPELVEYLKCAISEHVLVPVKLSGILRSTTKTGKLTHDLREKAGRAAVYIALLACKNFRESAKADLVNRNLLESRGNFAEILAILLISEHDRIDRLAEVQVATNHRPVKACVINSSFELFKVLTGQFDGSTEHGQMENALTIAVDAKATHFISDARVHETLKSIWRGDLVFSSAVAEGLESRLGARKARRIERRVEREAVRSRRKFRVSVDKLKVPRYHIDWLAHLLFIVAFGLRVAGQVLKDPDDRRKYNEEAFNILACCAALVWSRTLELLDTFREFGYLLITIRRMLKDARNFFILIAVLVLGFGQAYYALGKGLRDDGGEGGGDAGREEVTVAWVVNFLAMGLFQWPDYDKAASVRGVYGTVLFHVYLFIS